MLGREALVHSTIHLHKLKTGGVGRCLQRLDNSAQHGRSKSRTCTIALQSVNVPSCTGVALSDRPTNRYTAGSTCRGRAHKRRDTTDNRLLRQVAGVSSALWVCLQACVLGIHASIAILHTVRAVVSGARTCARQPKTAWYRRQCALTCSFACSTTIARLTRIAVRDLAAAMLMMTVVGWCC